MTGLIAPDRINTKRLVLRVPTLNDATAIFERYGQDPEVTRYLTWRPHESLERTRAFLERCSAVRRSGEAFTWVLTLKDDDSAVGMLALRPVRHRAEVGYVLARLYWNRGYMTEALRAMVGWALAQPELYRVWAVCDVENPASARVLEKAGFQREGILRRWLVHPNRSTEPRDCLCHAIVK